MFEFKQKKTERNTCKNEFKNWLVHLICHRPSLLSSLFIFLKVYFQVLYSLFTLYFSRTDRNNDMMTFTIHDMQGHESSWNSNCFILGFL